ncbi:plastid lipid-associated PAP/fibrillin family protein [Nitzschia inconspicua]|uniref:Plastid lipid-associated PAP/fibrillin family protein n=1 Tax=Nitzschia inconspicua TaxID=303405 RepID=A0A9K3KZJ4_9STRA|nr:plastid lipid-associated PAP/fibrillin family protein [Nitzschia inconspicua]
MASTGSQTGIPRINKIVQTKLGETVVDDSNVPVLKPVAMKVLRPIPKRASEQYYTQAHECGLNLQETNQAVVMAHEWHRRWTQQEEANHTTPHQDFYHDETDGSMVFPVHYAAALDFDRQGAKNPSLGGFTPCSAASSSGSSTATYGQDRNDAASFEERLKRTRQLVDSAARALDSQLEDIVFDPKDRLAGSLTSGEGNSISSSLTSYMPPQAKRRFNGAVLDSEDDDEESDVRHAPVTVRPVALRPVAIRPLIYSQMTHPQDVVPQDIMALYEDRSVSPMSCSPVSSSFSSSSDGVRSHVPHEGLATAMLQDQVHVVEDDEEPQLDALLARSSEVEKARDDILQTLAVTKGDVDSDQFKISVDPLEKYFSKEELDTRPHVVGTNSVDGMWLTLSKPTFFGCLGENDNGDPMYTLGRMSFDMFSPTNLVCSLQGNFNPVEVVNEEDRQSMLGAVPKSLRDEVESGKTILRTYHIVTAFTIEPSLASFPDAPNKDVVRPIKGIMTTYGYSLPDPNTPNRHSIWFTGGRIEPNNEASDTAAWKRLFSLHPPKHSFGEKAKLLAVKLLMGATVPEEIAEDGSMEYTFTRPLGGHGMAYIDVIYLDDSMRIVRGHRGTTFVFSRIPDQS